MDELTRKHVAHFWGIDPAQVKVPSEMTENELESLAWEYGTYWATIDTYAYAIRADGRVGRRDEIAVVMHRR